MSKIILFLVISGCSYMFSKFLLYVPICLKGVPIYFNNVSRFLLYVSGYFKGIPICLKGVPIYFNNVSIVSYMLKEYLKGVPVVSRLFQGFSYMFLYVFFLIKLFLVVSGSLNCFWLFFLYVSYMFIFEYSVFRHFWAFLGGFMVSMVFFTFLYI